MKYDPTNSIMKRYVVATLYDNDFQQHLSAGVPYIAQSCEHELTESEFAEWLIDFVAYYSAIRVVNRVFKKSPDEIANTRQYVGKHIRVWYTDDKPQYQDENWEFVMYDRSADLTWSA